MAKKITEKPVKFNDTVVFGSLEHRKLASKWHHNLTPWQIVHTNTDAELICKRVRLADKARIQRGEMKTPRSVCSAKLDDGSNGYGVFFLPTTPPTE